MTGESRSVTVIGGGPAGCIAALSAMRAGASVQLHEKRRLPQHKVCGEFLSPGIASILDNLGLWSLFQDAGVVRINRMALRVGRHRIEHRLSEPAFGLSRYTMDHLLLNAVQAAGAEVTHATCRHASPPAVAASGRDRSAKHQPAMDRLFGFKAHFDGPADDSVELFLFDRCYVGVSPVENGQTNVCGLAPVGLLREITFEWDELLKRNEPLAERLKPLHRTMDWLSTGPLVFRHRFADSYQDGIYPAGDALAFIDPFTGAGMLNAALTGFLAGQAAARNTPVPRYLRECERAIGRAFRTATLFRKLLASPWAERLAPAAPGALLFRATRPRLGRALAVSSNSG